jgi:hypothetical protein
MSTSSGARNFIGIVVGVVSFFIARESVGAARRAYHRWSAPPLEKAINESLRRLGATELLEQATRGMTEAQAESTGKSLSARGIARLSPDMALRRVKLLASIQQRMDVASCGQWWKGNVNPTVLRRTVEALPPADMKEWTEVSANALLAQLNHSPALDVPPDSAVIELFIGISAELPSEEQQPYLNAISEIGAQTDERACAVGRLTHQHIVSRPEPEAQRRAQLLAIVESPRR